MKKITIICFFNFCKFYLRSRV